MHKKSPAIFLALVASLSVAPAASFAFPAQGDIDGDGISDLSVAYIDREGDGAGSGGTMYLNYLSSTFGYTVDLFSVPADALVRGKFFGDGKSYPGVVRVKDTSVPLEWFVRNPNGGTVYLTYGLPGDTVPPQGDFDCDGITDIAVTRAGAGWMAPFKIWYIAKTKGGISEVLFGLKDDMALAADMDGDGCDELVVVRNNFTWFSKKLDRDTVTAVQWGLYGDYPLAPQDLDGDRAADYIISRPGENQQTVYVRYANGQTQTFVYSTPSTSVPLIGNFFGRGPIFAFYNKGAGQIDVLSTDGSGSSVAIGGPSHALVRPDGTVVQPSETGGFSSSSNGGSGALSGTGTAGCRVPRFPDGKNGRLWKPVKEGGSHTRGGPTYLSSNDIRKIELYGKDGSLVNTPKLRYYGGPGNRSTWDPTMTGKKLLPYAPLQLKEIFYDGSCVTVAVPNPTKRYD